MHPIRIRTNLWFAKRKTLHGPIETLIWLLPRFFTCFLGRLLEQILLNWLLSTKARWLPWSFSTTRVGTAMPTTIESSDGRILSRFCPFLSGFKARQQNLYSCRISSSQENVLGQLDEVSNGDFLGEYFHGLWKHCSTYEWFGSNFGTKWLGDPQRQKCCKTC